MHGRVMHCKLAQCRILTSWTRAAQQDDALHVVFAAWGEVMSAAIASCSPHDLLEVGGSIYGFGAAKVVGTGDAVCCSSRRECWVTEAGGRAQSKSARCRAAHCAAGGRMPVVQLTTLELFVVNGRGLGPLQPPCAILNHHPQNA